MTRALVRRSSSSTLRRPLDRGKKRCKQRVRRFSLRHGGGPTRQRECENASVPGRGRRQPDSFPPESPTIHSRRARTARLTPDPLPWREGDAKTSPGALENNLTENRGSRTSTWRPASTTNTTLPSSAHDQETSSVHTSTATWPHGPSKLERNRRRRNTTQTNRVTRLSHLPMSAPSHHHGSLT